MRQLSAVGAVCAAALCATPVLAQSPARPAAVGFAAYGFEPAQARNIRNDLRNAARKAQLTGLVDPKLEAAAFDGRTLPDPSAELAEAKRLLDLGEDRVKAFRIEDGKQNILEAAKVLRPYVGLTIAREYDRRRLELAVAIAHAERDEKAVSNLLRTFLGRFWTVKSSDTAWPPDVRDQLDQIRSQVPMRTLVIGSRIPAFAAVDGRPVGPTPAEVRVPVGRHRVEVGAADFLAQETFVDVPENSGAPVKVLVSPESPLIHALTSVRSLDRALEAKILEEAARWGITTVYAAGPAPHNQVRLARLGPDPAGPIVVGPDVDNLRVGLLQLWPAPAVSSEPTVWPWVTAGAGAAAVGVGVAVRMVAKSTQDDFQTRRHLLTQSEAFDLRDQGNREATTGSVLIGAGLAALAGGLTWAIFEWVKDEEP